MEGSLADRINSYQEISDYQLMKRLPVVIVLNGRSFSKISSLFDKPYSSEFMELMCSTVVKLCQEVEGVFFAYVYSDQIVIALRNDQTFSTEAWYNNKIQSIVSVASSLATLEFNRAATKKNIKLLGDAIFLGKVFSVPNSTELANTLIHMQQNCFHAALYQACFYELIKIYDANTAKKMISNKGPKEKAQLLSSECNINFNNYPTPFKRGIAAYRAPKFNPNNGEIKNKFILNDELPLFTQDKEWLFSLVKSGTDVIGLEEKNVII